MSKEESERIHREALDATIGKPIKISKSECSADRRAIMSLDSEFTFGKYKHKKTLQEVIDADHSYIEWCLENDIVYIDEEATAYFGGETKPLDFSEGI